MPLGKMIIKSINERSKLEAHAFNTIQEFKYLKTCPKEVFYSVRVKVMMKVKEYRTLRACLDNYQDKNTIKRDRQLENIVKVLNNSDVFNVLNRERITL